MYPFGVVVPAVRAGVDGPALHFRPTRRTCCAHSEPCKKGAVGAGHALTALLDESSRARIHGIGVDRRERLMVHGG